MTSGVGMTHRRRLAGAIYPLDSAVRTEQTPTGWLLRFCLLLGNRARRSEEALARAIDFDRGTFTVTALAMMLAFLCV
jgi:hypothetical protein